MQKEKTLPLEESEKGKQTGENTAAAGQDYEKPEGASQGKKAGRRYFPTRNTAASMTGRSRA